MNCVSEYIELSYDFKEECPICGGRDCAIFIGYYYREVVDEKGTHYKYLPIARYLCREKGKKKEVKHRTFSLLPYQLVPYMKYSIPYILKIAQKRYEEGKSIKELQEYMSRIKWEGREYREISERGVKGVLGVMKEAMEKIIMSGWYVEGKEYSGLGERESMRKFVEYIEGFRGGSQEEELEGPSILGYEYYLRGGGFRNNSHFLYGRASQFRSL